MKLSYWGFIKEKEFNEWLDSFDIDYSYSSCVINKINNEREYELLVSKWDLVIKWNVSYKEYNDELGGCITRINLSTWENGFTHRSKWINLELTKIDRTSRRYRITNIFKVLKITGNDIVDIESDSMSIFKKELNDYMLRINPELSKKFIRNNKIKDILN